ncbi:unnamed protein product, partial [Laminaria digitata]
PVPLGVCVAATGMLLATTIVENGDTSAGNGPGEGLNGRDKEEVLLWLWRVLQVNYPGASSTVETPSGPGDVPLWGSHPLIPAIACLLTGRTPGDLTGDPTSLRYNRTRRERGGFIDWMANQLNTGPYPMNHLGTLVGRSNASRRLNGDDGFPSPADAAVRLAALLLKGERAFVERWF